MTNPRLIALWAVLTGCAVLAAVVASHTPLWNSWPGSAVRFGGYVAVAAALYSLAGRWDRRAAGAARR